MVILIWVDDAYGLISWKMDLEIGQYALPRLIGETITAQSARIDTVSGATYTSGGYIESLQSALDNGG